MIQDQNNKQERNKTQESSIPPAPTDSPIDADESAHELSDREPDAIGDADDFVHTFPPKPEIKKTDDIDDLLHPPAIDGDDPEI